MDVGEKRVKFSLIPALAFAGLVSAIFNIWFWYPATATGGETLFVILASLSLGLALGSVLWFYRLIQTGPALVVTLAVMLAAHLLAQYTELRTPTRFREWVDIPAIGNVKPIVAITSFEAVFIVLVTFLLLTIPRCKTVWALVIAFASASLAAGTVTVVDGTQKGAWITFLGGNELEAVWQLSLAATLAIALVLKGLTTRPEDHAGDPSFKNRAVAFGIAALFWAGVATWVHFFDVREAKRIHELQLRQKAELARSLAAAPSIESLPMPAPKPLDQVLLLEEISGWKPYYSGSQEQPARKGVEGRSAALPALRRYDAAYARTGASAPVRATVTEYPNAEWAKYEVSNRPTAHAFINDPNSIKRLTKFGNILFRDGPYLFWSSGSDLIFLDCQVKPDVVEEFLKAYLAKYPSSLE